MYLIEYFTACQYLFECVWMYIYIYITCACMKARMYVWLPTSAEWLGPAHGLRCQPSHSSTISTPQKPCEETCTSTSIHTVHINIQCYRSCMYVQYVCLYSMWGCMYLCTYLRIYVYFRIEYLRCIINVCMFIWPVWD